MLFVDYKQVYDSINRNSLWKAMEKLVVPEKNHKNDKRMCSEL